MSFEHVLLCIRGTLADGNDLDRARETHNATAGNPEGVAAARALGDLSHKVFGAAKGAPGGAQPDELLILDVWQTPDAIQKFFSNPQVQGGGAKLFKHRDPVVFMPAKGALTFNLPAPLGKNEKYVGVVRGIVKTPEAAIEAFQKNQHPANMNLARQRGQLSHDLYVRLDSKPGGPVEVLGVDTWYDAAGMAKHYAETMGALSSVFVEPPKTSVWTPPPGIWVEW